MIGCVTQEALAAIEKGRKKREREGRERDEAMTAAHAAADGAAGPGRDEDCVPVSEIPDAGKAYADRSISPGPGHPVMPGHASPGDFNRPYISEGHGAPSPGYQGPNHLHVDLRGDRGHVQPLSPHAPIPVEGPRT